MRYRKTVRNIQLGLENLMLHKLRSMLTMLGIVFGVGSVIAMLSVGEGASRQALDQIRKLGSNNIIISAMRPVDESQDTTRRRSLMYGLTYDDEQRIRETFDTVVRTVPVKTLQKEARIGSRTMELRLVGTTADWFDLVRREMIAGRPLMPEDQQEKRAVAVLTEHGARRMLALDSALGQHIRIGGNYFEVVGIVRTEGESGAVQTPDRETDAYVPLGVARERFGDMDQQVKAGSFQREEVELHQVIIEATSLETVEPTAEAVRRMLATTHDHEDYRISVPLALLRQAEKTKRTFNIVLGSIACISLLVGGIGIMNIMLASVTERTREIGIRRAIGARKRQIVSQFLTETVVLSTVGGIIGICVGLLIPLLISRLSGMPTVVTPWSVCLSLGISLGIGIVFGLYPASRAANLDPIEALRHE